jgi:hypothetical protein
MTIRFRAATLVAFALVMGSALHAQVPDSTARRQQRTLDSLVTVLRRLQARIDSLSGAHADTGGGDELAALRAAAGATSAAADTVRAQPQQARLGQNALNPEISVTGDFRFSGYRPGPQAATPEHPENFVAREFEIGFQSVLDPYATAKVFASFGHGETPAIEEGYLYFPALPGGFRVDLGRFREELGELNRWHLHAVPEDEYPLVIRRFGSDEGVSGTGISIYHPLLSGRAGTYDLYLQGTTADNEVLYGGGSNLSVSGKLAGFWQLSRATYLMASVSGAHGTNRDSVLNTTLGVLAVRFTWRPPQQGVGREFTLRGELWNLRRRFAAIGPWRRGWYADATLKTSRTWVFGTRVDWVESPDAAVTGHEWAITPSITRWQSEFVFLKALWEHARDFTGTDRDRLTLQVVFAMGPHKHELF